MQGYCVKCKVKRDMKGGETVTTKNNRQMVKGTCVNCNGKMNVFVSSQKSNK